MKLVVNNIELETSEIDGLIFAASNIAARAKSCKTYTIEIPATSRNTQALGDIWTVHELRSYKFTAYMRTDTIDIPGVLIIDSFNRYSASGNFVFGVGIVGSLLEGVRLRDVDFSELDHTIADFADAYCDGSLDYVYDLGSRGLYKGAAVAVDEVYPAYNCKKLLEILLSGYNPDLSDVDDSLFTIYTGDIDILGSKDVLRNGIYKLNADNNFSKGFDNESAFSIDETFDMDENLDIENDPGGNVNGLTGEYTTPEAASYQFELSYEIDINFTSSVTPIPRTVSYNSVNDRVNLTISIVGSNGGSTTALEKVLTLDDFNVSDSGTVKAYLKELAAGAVYKVQARIECDVSATSSPGDGDINLGAVLEGTIEGKVSRYYGHGSTVETARMLPDIAATDYIKWLCNVMNLLIYADPLINDIRIVRQSARGAVGTLELDQVQQTIEARKDFQLVFDNDDASGLDEVISFPVLDYGEIAEYKTGIARTSIGLNTQVNGTAVPILIQEDDKWETKLNARVLQLTGSESETWQLELFEETYTGLTDIDKVPTWSEIDYESLFVQAANRGIRVIEGVGRLLPEMYTVERYMFPVNVKDIRTGELLGYGYIVKAEQVSGDVYKYTIEI